MISKNLQKKHQYLKNCLLTDEDATVENEEDSDNGSDFGSDSCDEIDEPLWVIPLYSMLSSHEQNKVFQPAPESSRYFFKSFSRFKKLVFRKRLS